MPVDIVTFCADCNPHLPELARLCFHAGRAVCVATLHLPAPSVVYLCAALAHGLRVRHAQPHHAGADMVHCLHGLAMAAAIVAIR